MSQHEAQFNGQPHALSDSEIEWWLDTWWAIHARPTAKVKTFAGFQVWTKESVVRAFRQGYAVIVIDRDHEHPGKCLLGIEPKEKVDLLKIYE